MVSAAPQTGGLIGGPVAPAVEARAAHRFGKARVDNRSIRGKNCGMDLQSFTTSLSLPEPPGELRLALQALWWDAKGDWDKAHQCAQARDDAAGMRVHAYLHRKEGDAANAGYWYRRVGVTPATSSLADEWTAIAEELLKDS
jgi:hypothetical protein